MMFIYGGYADILGALGDVWSYDLQNGVWMCHHSVEQPAPYKKGGLPVPRYGHCSVVSGGKMWTYGGHSGKQALADLWSFDLSGFYWSRQSTKNHGPGATHEHCVSALEEGLLVYLPSKGALYYLDLTALTWVSVGKLGANTPLLTKPSFNIFSGVELQSVVLRTQFSKACSKFKSRPSPFLNVIFTKPAASKRHHKLSQSIPDALNQAGNDEQTLCPSNKPFQPFSKGELDESINARLFKNTNTENDRNYYPDSIPYLENSSDHILSPDQFLVDHLAENYNKMRINKYYKKQMYKAQSTDRLFIPVKSSSIESYLEKKSGVRLRAASLAYSGTAYRNSAFEASSENVEIPNTASRMRSSTDYVVESTEVGQATGCCQTPTCCLATGADSADAFSPVEGSHVLLVLGGRPLESVPFQSGPLASLTGFLTTPLTLGADHALDCGWEAETSF